MRLEAIQLLVAERQGIDTKLALLGFDRNEPIELSLGADGTYSAKKKTRTCKKCGQAGHNAKGCPATSPAEMTV